MENFKKNPFQNLLFKMEIFIENKKNLELKFGPLRLKIIEKNCIKIWEKVNVMGSIFFFWFKTTKSILSFFWFKYD